MDDTRGGVGAGELELLGLSRLERLLYEALVEHGSATASELRAMLPDDPQRLLRLLKGLEAQGLIGRAPGRPVRYAPVPPEVGLELLFVRREEELRRARMAAVDLTERFHQTRARRDLSGLVEMVSGERAVRKRIATIHGSAREQLRAMSHPPYMQPAEENRAMTREAHEVGVRIRNIIDTGYLEADDWRFAAVQEDIAHGEQFRSMASPPLRLLVADDRAALVPLEIHPKGIQSAALFHASALLEALIEVFETCWRFATPLDLLGADEEDENSSAESLGGEERKLLALLSAGMLDKGIARQLGISHTTVQRRIYELKARLGATTRFQAGVQAALRGWITNQPRPPETPN